MKRIQFFLIGVFIAVGSVWAQNTDSDWHGELAKIKELIQNNPTQAADNAEQLVKKNKKNVDLLVALGNLYLDANKIPEAQSYVELARKANKKSAAASVLEGNIAVANKNAGLACQKYEEAIYFEPNYTEAYLKYADVYKSADPNSAIEKLKQLKNIDPSNTEADRKLAEIYYLKNDFKNASAAYAVFASRPDASEEDLVKYAFALFLNHDFNKSLEIANIGLKKSPRHAAFNRLAMYNYTDMKRYDDAYKAADLFFNQSDKADFSYLDYMYSASLLNALKKYDEAVVQYEKALQLDPEKTELLKEISNAYEKKGDNAKAIEAYKKYYASLSADKQTPDLQFQLGVLCYSAGSTKDSLSVTKADKIKYLKEADTIFAAIAQSAPDSHLGNLWRARSNSALDPETTQGLAKPFYEEVAKLLESKKEARYNSVLIECYKYLGYYYLVTNKMQDSKIYWNKILAIDPTDVTAKKALDGIK